MDPGSSVANRFMIIFSPLNTLPITFTNVKAYQQNANIAVEWKVNNERNIQNYQVDKSIDGNTFNTVSTVAAQNASIANYNWLDVNAVNGNNFYRVKSIDLNGQIKYSVIVKVTMGSVKPSIAIYPNPVTDGTMNLQMLNMPSGKYTIRLINTLGQVMFANQIDHQAGSSSEAIILGKLAKGNYELNITKPDQTIFTTKLVKE